MGDDKTGAVLTPSQRDFLKGEDDSELSDAAARMTKKRIRDRLRASIFDLELVASTLPLGDIDKALSEPDESEWQRPGYPPVANAIPSLVALIYLRNRDTEVQAEDRHDGWMTEATVEEGIQRAFGKLEIELNDIHVRIEIQRGGSLEDLAEGEENLASLTQEQLSQLHRSNIIDIETLIQTWFEKRERGEKGGRSENEIEDIVDEL